MQYKFFTIPIKEPAAAEEDLNKFLRSHRVLNVYRDFVSDSGASCWCCCVEYLDSNSEGRNIPHELSAKVDYRTILTEDEFARFRVLRECRKAISVEDAVPAYAVFIDEQLASIAKLKEISSSSLKTISGIGEKKIEKYAERFVKLWNEKSGELKAKQSDQVLPILMENKS